MEDKVRQDRQGDSSSAGEIDRIIGDRMILPSPADDEPHLSYDLSSIAHRATEEALAK